MLLGSPGEPGSPPAPRGLAYFGLREPVGGARQGGGGVAGGSAGAGGGGLASAPLFSAGSGGAKKRPRLAAAPEGAAPRPGSPERAAALDGAKDAAGADLAASPLPGASGGPESRLWRQRLMEASAECVSLRRALEDERAEGSRREKQLEREARLERLKAEQKASELAQSAASEEDLRRQLKRAEMQYLHEKHQAADRLSKLEKDLRKVHARGEETARALQAQVSEITHELEYARRVAQDRASDLERQGKAPHGGQAAAASAAAAAAAAAREEQAALEARVRALEAENRDLSLQAESLRRGVAVEERAGALARELGEEQRRGRALRERLAHLEADLSAAQAAAQELSATKQQAARLQEQREALVAAETERDALRAERREWTTLFARAKGPRPQQQQQQQQGLPDVNPVRVLSMLLELENAHALQAQRKADLEVALVQAKSALERECEASRAAAAARRAAEERLAAATERVAEMERRLGFVGKERESLQRVLANVADEPFATAATASKEVEEQRGVNSREVAQLQQSLAAAHARVEALQAENDAAARNGALSPALAKAQADALAAADKRTEAAEHEARQAAARLEKALDKIAELEHAVNAGAFNPARTRVLHMAVNPEQQVRAAQSAKAADDKETGPDGGATGGSNLDPDKRSERLKQMFKEKTKAFKEAVYLLTGYKIDMMDGRDEAGQSRPQLRLRSMFAERPDDELVFQWNMDGGGLELLETPFCKFLDENTFAYLTKCNSVPAFLATLSLDLFGKQTLLLA